MSFNILLISQESDSLIEFHYTKIPDDSAKAMELYKKGFDTRSRNIHDAFIYAKASENSALNSKNKFVIAKANNLLGILYFKTGKLSNAEYHHNYALSIWESINNKEGIGLTLINLGNIYSDKNQKENAEQAYLEAFSIFNELKNDKQKANALNNIGIIKFENGNISIAKHYFEKAYQLAEKLNDYELKAFCLNNIGATYEREKNWNEAWANYDDARELRELMDNQTDLVDSYINLASVSLENNKINQAKEYISKAFGISETQEYAEGKIALYDLNVKLFITINEADSAIFYQKLFYEEKLKLIEESKDAETNFIPTANSKTEQHSIAELKNQNYVLYYLIAVLSVFLLMLIYLLFRQKK
jgi:tetratricopeptide (TPR) repeat protein